MNSPQYDVVPMTTKHQPNEVAQELTRFFRQSKKTLSILSYNNQADESVKPVLNTLAGYESNHESSPFSTNDVKDVTNNFINVFTAMQNLKYHDCPYKPVIWLRMFMKTHNVDYVNDSYPGVHFSQDNATDTSLKHRF